jgi:hypothetical protein
MSLHKQFGLDLVFLLGAEGDVFDCHKFMLRVHQFKTNKQLWFTFCIVIAYFVFVVDLGVMLDGLKQNTFLIQQFDRISRLISDNVVRNES